MPRAAKIFVFHGQLLDFGLFQAPEGGFNISLFRGNLQG
jgi:hypothetical protein